MSRLLVVDDESSICWGIQQLGGQLGHEVLAAPSAELGLQLAEQHAVDLLLLDVRLPGMDGLTAIEHFRRHLPAAPIIVMTAFGDLSTAVRALGAGAFEFVVKPFDLDEISAAIGRALQPPPVTGEPTIAEMDGMVGASATMRQVFKRIALAAHSDASVLLVGESGVGKQLAARAIHNHSRRRGQPFVVANLSQLELPQAEAELFGAVADPSDDTQQTHRGLLAQANGGTLLFDELAEIPPPLQARLLRALDQQEVTPIGGDQPAAASCRVVAATRYDLEQLLSEGELRHDLFYRLSAFPIPLPPLRDREDDVVRLAEHFVSQFGSPDSTLAPATAIELRRRRWPGNVRELRSAIEHALVLARTGAVLPEHLPQELSALVGAETSIGTEQATDDALRHLAAAFADNLLDDESAAGLVHERFLDAIEPALLEQALAKFSHEVAPAARALGLHRTTLRRKLDQYGIDTKGR